MNSMRQKLFGQRERHVLAHCPWHCRPKNSYTSNNSHDFSQNLRFNLMFLLFIYLKILSMHLFSLPSLILSFSFFSFRWFFFITHDSLTSFLSFPNSFNTHQLQVCALSCPLLLLQITCTFSHHV